MRHLEQAMGRADSAYVAGRRNWLISEDPDLDGLRSHVSFKHFEAMYFPSPRATPQRPRDLHQWELSRYTQDLLTATAWRWEACWHRRGRRLDSRPDLHEMLDWWTDEASAWERVQQVARHHRHWRARYELIADMQGWTAKYGLEAMAVSHPRYTDDSGDGTGEGQQEGAAERTVAARDLRLKELDGRIAHVEREKQEACSPAARHQALAVRAAPVRRRRPARAPLAGGPPVRRPRRALGKPARMAGELAARGRPRRLRGGDRPHGRPLAGGGPALPHR